MSRNMIGSMIAYEKDDTIIVGAAYHDASVYPDDTQNVETFVWTYTNMSMLDAIRQAENVLNQEIGDRNANCLVFVDRHLTVMKQTRELGFTTFVEGVADVASVDLSPKDPQCIRANHIRRAVQPEFDRINRAKKPVTRPLNIVVTGGPAGIATGSLGDYIVETMLDAGGDQTDYAARIGKLYYITPKMAYNPVVSGAQARKLKQIHVRRDEDIIAEIASIASAERIDLIIHTSTMDEQSADCSLDGMLEMAGCEPDVVKQAKQPPRAVAKLRDMAPDALIFGIKIRANVTEKDLFRESVEMRQANRLDFVIASDLACIGAGKHPAMFIDNNDTVIAAPKTAHDIAGQLCEIAFSHPRLPAYTTEPGTLASGSMAGKTYWHVIAANNMNTDVRIEGFAENKADAWRIMAAEFKKTANELIPDIAVPEAEYLDMNDEHDFGDDKRHIKINQDGAQVFDGSDMWYYNLVPMSYAAVEN